MTVNVFDLKDSKSLLRFQSGNQSKIAPLFHSLLIHSSQAFAPITQSKTALSIDICDIMLLNLMLPPVLLLLIINIWQSWLTSTPQYSFIICLPGHYTQFVFLFYHTPLQSQLLVSFFLLISSSGSAPGLSSESPVLPSFLFSSSLSSPLLPSPFHASHSLPSSCFFYLHAFPW